MLKFFLFSVALAFTGTMKGYCDEALLVTANGMGPIRDDSKIDADFLKKAFPNFSVSERTEQYAEGEEGLLFEIKKGHSTYMTVEVDEHGRPWRIIVKTGPVATPSGVSIGDQLKKLEDQNREMDCETNLMDPGFYCWQEGGFDHIRYVIDRSAEKGEERFKRRSPLWKKTREMTVKEIIWSLY